MNDIWSNLFMINILTLNLHMESILHVSGGRLLQLVLLDFWTVSIVLYSVKDALEIICFCPQTERWWIFLRDQTEYALLTFSHEDRNISFFPKCCVRFRIWCDRQNPETNNINSFVMPKRVYSDKIIEELQNHSNYNGMIGPCSRRVLRIMQSSHAISLLTRHFVLNYTYYLKCETSWAQLCLLCHS
jgi:hypothetical protein